MTTAFVLSGGGSLGAVQVGMLRALADRGVAPDLLVGASAGALNAAFVADRGFTPTALDELEQIWRRLRRQDVFPLSPHRQLLALAGARPSLCAADGLRRVIDRHLRVDHLEDTRIPVHVVATDVLSGNEVRLSTGDARAAVLASASIPAVLPPVLVEGRALFDGGVANNTPISHAVALGAERVVVLPAGVACALAHPPRSAVATAIHALTLATSRTPPTSGLPCPSRSCAANRNPRLDRLGGRRVGAAGGCRGGAHRPAPTPLQALFGDTLGGVFRSLHAERGVHLRLGAGVRALHGNGTADALELTDGRREAADVVVVGIGVNLADPDLPRAALPTAATRAAG